MILITGINGFIGSQIARILVNTGHRVRGLVRQTSNLSNLSDIKLKIDFVPGDIRHKETLKKAFSRVDICFHTAALVKDGDHTKDDYFSNNLQGTINVCEMAMESGVKKFIYTSTCETLRGNSFQNMVGDYGRSKFLAEEHVKACITCGLPAVILNPTAVLGPYDINTTPPTSLILKYSRGEIPIYFETGFNVVDVRDVAVAHVLTFEKGKIGERYTIGGKNVYLSELFREIRKSFGVKPFSIKLPYFLISAGAGFLSDKKHLKEKIRASRRPFFLDSSKAEKELGFMPKFQLEKTLKDYWEWKLVYCKINS